MTQVAFIVLVDVVFYDCLAAHRLGLEALALGVVAPGAPQRAALEEDGRSDTRAVVQRELTNLENPARHGVYRMRTHVEGAAPTMANVPWTVEESGVSPVAFAR